MNQIDRLINQCEDDIALITERCLRFPESELRIEMAAITQARIYLKYEMLVSDLGLAICMRGSVSDEAVKDAKERLVYYTAVKQVAYKDKKKAQDKMMNHS